MDIPRPSLFTSHPPPPNPSQAYHRAWPARPTAATECCSCLSQRGEDVDITPHVNPKKPGNNSVFYSNFNADCVKEQTQWSDALTFVAGTYVWTLHDYMGEPGGWPHVSSSFGAFDIAGFPKAAAWLYRCWWLGNIPVTDAGRPGLNISRISPIQIKGRDLRHRPVTAIQRDIKHLSALSDPRSTVVDIDDPTATFVHIVETPLPQPSARVVHVYTNAPFVRFEGQMQSVLRFGYATFNVSTPHATTSAQWTAEAIAEDGVTVLATHAVVCGGDAASLKLSIDAPTPRTGMCMSVCV